MNNTSNSLPAFTGRNVPIKEIAQATGKDPQYIRIGLQKGIFRFGYAFKKDGSSEYNYLCPDKKVWEDLGFFRIVFYFLYQLHSHKIYSQPLKAPHYYCLT